MVRPPRIPTCVHMSRWKSKALWQRKQSATPRPPNGIPSTALGSFWVPSLWTDWAKWDGHLLFPVPTSLGPSLCPRESRARPDLEADLSPDCADAQKEKPASRGVLCPCPTGDAAWVHAPPATLGSRIRAAQPLLLKMLTFHIGVYGCTSGSFTSNPPSC